MQDSPVGISQQQFARMQERLSAGTGKGQGKAKPKVTSVVSQNSHHQSAIVLGIDPSLRGTGYGIVRKQKNTLTAIDQGTIRCPATWEHSRCLGHIADHLTRLSKAHKPTLCVVEGLFFAQNLKTAIVMGQARGAALAVVGQIGLEVYEISPRKVKQAIVGYGAAQKSAVAKMVQRMLNLTEEPEPDAADALALALTFLQETHRHRLNPPKRV